MRKRLSPDFHLRQKIAHCLINTIVLRSIQRNKSIFKPIHHRKMTKSFYKFPNFGKIHDFCSVTGRGRSIIHKFKFSRNIFKMNVNLGLLYSMRKASW
jgi:ribosomal protein S14